MAVIKYKDTNGNVHELPLIVPMDAALSSTSENGVQNKVIKQEIDNINNTIGNINTILDNINGEVI